MRAPPPELVRERLEGLAEAVRVLGLFRADEDLRAEPDVDLLRFRELDFLAPVDLRVELDLRPPDELDLRPPLELDLRPPDELARLVALPVFLRAAEAPPLRSPVRAGCLFVFLPRPEPLFFPPPLVLLTVAQALRSASFFGTPRFS